MTKLSLASRSISYKGSESNGNNKNPSEVESYDITSDATPNNVFT